MSLSNFTLKLLNLKDENINFTEKLEASTIKGVLYNIINATLTYNPQACPICGCINEDFSIIKYGTKISNIKILPCNGAPTILRLRKQRFLCKECSHTFIAHTNIVAPNCFISNQVKLKVLETLSLKISEKDISIMNYISHSTVNRAINNSYTSFKPHLGYLPKHLMFDEFKSTKDAKGSMSFIVADADTHDIIDIVENRQLPFLKKYFGNYTKAARSKVETICIDMYDPYISLIKELFPNTKIILDRFHIVQLLSRALNKTRIKTMSNYSTYSIEYKRLKRYWKLFQINESYLTRTEFKKKIHFPQWVSTKTLVETSLSIDNQLYSTYDAFQMLYYDINTKDKNALKNHLKFYQTEDISDYMKIAINSILKNFDYVANALDYKYSNGAIEGINNYIKTIKRIAFGYKSFYHFRNRILISKKLIKPIEKRQVA